MRTNKQKSQILGVIATLLSITASLLYNWNILSGDSHPNLSSWLVWLFITALHFFSYKEVTEGWEKSLLPKMDSILCVTTTVLVWHIGSLKSLNIYEWSCLVLGIFAGIGWRVFKSPTWAQILLQTALVVGGIPTIMSIWVSPIREPGISWFIWTCTFTAQYFAVKVNWDGKRIAYLYPVCMIIFHLIVFGLIVT